MCKVEIRLQSFALVIYKYTKNKILNKPAGIEGVLFEPCSYNCRDVTIFFACKNLAMV